MSKKTLLEESTIRKFMKYANIGHLTENYLDEEVYEEEPEAAAVEDEFPPEAGDEFPIDDVADDVADEEEAIVDTSEASVEALVDALADTITQVTGVEVTAAGDADAELDGDADAELPGDEGPVDDLALDDAPPSDEEEVIVQEEVVEETETLDEDAVIEETMKRVMTRLQGIKNKNVEAKKRNELIEAVAAAVEKRLASK